MAFIVRGWSTIKLAPVSFLSRRVSLILAHMVKLLLCFFSYVSVVPGSDWICFATIFFMLARIE